MEAYINKISYDIERHGFRKGDIYISLDFSFKNEEYFDGSKVEVILKSGVPTYYEKPFNEVDFLNIFENYENETIMLDMFALDHSDFLQKVLPALREKENYIGIHCLPSEVERLSAVIDNIDIVSTIIDSHISDERLEEYKKFFALIGERDFEVGIHYDSETEIAHLSPIFETLSEMCPYTKVNLFSICNNTELECDKYHKLALCMFGNEFFETKID